nr:hypothetical protein BgiMline_026163 [Biomphalaria glabrata]
MCIRRLGTLARRTGRHQHVHQTTRNTGEEDWASSTCASDDLEHWRGGLGVINMCIRRLGTLARRTGRHQHVHQTTRNTGEEDWASSTCASDD